MNIVMTDNLELKETYREAEWNKLPHTLKAQLANDNI